MPYSVTNYVFIWVITFIRKSRINTHLSLINVYTRKAVRRMPISFALPKTEVVAADFECISFALEVYLKTLFCDIFCFSDFFGGRDGQTDEQT